MQNTPESAPHGYPIGLTETDWGEESSHQTAATAFWRSRGDPPGSWLMACRGSRGGRTPSRSPHPRRREAAELAGAGAEDKALPPLLLVFLLFQRVRAQSLGADAAGGPSGRRLAGRSLGGRPLRERPLGRPSGRAPGGPWNKLAGVLEACAVIGKTARLSPACKSASNRAGTGTGMSTCTHVCLPEHTSTCAHTGAHSHTQTHTSLRRRCPICALMHRHSHTRAQSHTRTHTETYVPALAHQHTGVLRRMCSHTHSSLAPFSTHARECLPRAVA